MNMIKLQYWSDSTLQKVETNLTLGLLWVYLVFQEQTKSYSRLDPK